MDVDAIPPQRSMLMNVEYSSKNPFHVFLKQQKQDLDNSNGRVLPLVLLNLIGEYLQPLLLVVATDNVAIYVSEIRVTGESTTNTLFPIIQTQQRSTLQLIMEHNGYDYVVRGYHIRDGWRSYMSKDKSVSETYFWGSHYAPWKPRVNWNDQPRLTQVENRSAYLYCGDTVFVCGLFHVSERVQLRWRLRNYSVGCCVWTIWAIAPLSVYNTMTKEEKHQEHLNRRICKGQNVYVTVGYRYLLMHVIPVVQCEHQLPKHEAFKRNVNLWYINQHEISFSHETHFYRLSTTKPSFNTAFVKDAVPDPRALSFFIWNNQFYYSASRTPSQWGQQYPLTQW